MVPVKLVNHSPSRRVGPLERLDRGQYKGQRVEDIIRRSPQYIMYCVKEWLDISPWQALVFEEVTGGGIIPDAYIKEKSPSEGDQDSWTARDHYLYNTNQDILPNWDFYPDSAPEWWEEFKDQPEYHSSRPSVRVDLYNKYVRTYMDKSLWQDSR